MVLAGSFWRKVVVTAIVAVAFVSLYEATMLDPRDIIQPGIEATTIMPTPEPGARLSFVATAYCKGLTTQAGVAVQAGIAAADPALLPIGSIVDVASVAAIAHAAGVPHAWRARGGHSRRRESTSSGRLD